MSIKLSDTPLQPYKQQAQTFRCTPNETESTHPTQYKPTQNRMRTTSSPTLAAFIRTHKRKRKGICLHRRMPRHRHESSAFRVYAIHFMSGALPKLHFHFFDCDVVRCNPETG